MNVKISDLLPAPIEVEISPGKMLPLRPLSLQDIVKLLLTHKDSFLAAYAESTAKVKPDYGKFLLSAPLMCVDIIALSADADGQQEDIKRIPGTVQLIALSSIWKVSVPDPKKLKESLSEVMDELRRLSDQNEKETKTQPSVEASAPVVQPV